MRLEIERLVQLGPLPSEMDASVDHLRQVEVLLQTVSPPVSDEEARALASLFGPDGCFGLAWTILHLIESSPSWPLAECIANSNSEWVTLLRDRAFPRG